MENTISKEELNKLIDDAMSEINAKKEMENDEDTIVTNENPDSPSETETTKDESTPKVPKDVEPTPEPEAKEEKETNSNFAFLGVDINIDGNKATLTKDGETKEYDLETPDSMEEVFKKVEEFLVDVVKKDEPSEDTENSDLDEDVEEETSMDNTNEDVKQLEDKLNVEDTDLDFEDDDLDDAPNDDEDDEDNLVKSSKILPNGVVLCSNMNALKQRYADKIDKFVELGLETKNAVLSSVSEITNKKPISILSSKITTLKTEKENNIKKENNITKKYLLAKKVNKNVHNTLNNIIASLKVINNNSGSFTNTQLETEMKNIKILASQFINSKTPETILASCISIDNNNKKLNEKITEYKNQKEAVIAKRIEKNKLNNIVSERIALRVLSRTRFKAEERTGFLAATELARRKFFV